MLPKVVFTDIDGVWTDDCLYYDNEGNEQKKFNMKDGWGVKFLKNAKIPLYIITGEDNDIIRKRAEKLKIENVITGAKNKLEIVKRISLKKQFSFREIAFIGNDLNDLSLLKEVGVSACPLDAPDYIKSEVDFVMTKKGGEGVFREFVELLLKDYSFLP